MSDEMMNLKQIVNTLKLMAITAKRLADHATIVADGELILEMDTLALQVQNVGMVADQLLGMMVDNTATDEIPAVKAS